MSDQPVDRDGNEQRAPINDHCIVFEGSGGPNGNYEGIRTFSGWVSKEAVQEFLSTYQGEDTIVASDVTREEAQRLCREVSGATQARAAVQRVREGEMNPEMAFLLGAMSVADDSAEKLYEYLAELERTLRK